VPKIHGPEFMPIRHEVVDHLCIGFIEGCIAC
jgi:hypothetical protein